VARTHAGRGGHAQDAPRDQGREQARLQLAGAVVSTTEQRDQARIAKTVQGQGSQGHWLHESIVHAEVAENPPRRVHERLAGESICCTRSPSFSWSRGYWDSSGSTPLAR